MKKSFLWVSVALMAGGALFLVESGNTPVSVVEKEIEPATLVFTPTDPIQGEPVLVRIENLSGTTGVRSISFDNKALGVFDNSALIGIDLRQNIGNYPVVATLSDGTVLNKNLAVRKRPVVQTLLGIPEKLGGDTSEAEKELLNTLVRDGAIINAIPTAPRKLWSGGFRAPIDPPVTITDSYGYSRLTGASSIAHKGTDFRAATGTPVYAINSGLARYVGFLRNYGHIVALDHGLGLVSIYMHLSEVLVNEGESVPKGALIAKSGETGYALGPHLHLSVRINQISIDPEKFMALMGGK